MTQRKTATPKNEPIVLSGSVFLDGILADDVPRARMPARLAEGDIRLHCVNKSGERTRFGEKKTFSGFIVASVWNGDKFRRLLLRKRAAIESTYVGPVARRERVIAIMRHLSSTLVRRQAFWYGKNKGYEVPYNGAAPPAPQVVAPAVIVKVEVQVADHPVDAIKTSVLHVTARKRPRRKVAVDPNQMALFPDQT